MKKIIDTHVHSSFSFDGENTPREMIEYALKSGLHALTFTEHIDADEYLNTYYSQYKLIPAAAGEIPPLKDEYKGKINVGFGAEIGQFLHNPELAQSLISELGLDFIIGAAHVVKGFKDCYYIDYHETDPLLLLPLYFGEILEMARRADIDVIGHLTYPLRYITGRDGIEVDISAYTNIIQEICEAAAERGLGLEINTGGIRKRGYGKADPGLEFVKLFRAAGGEIITIGSDAHRIEDIAADFKDGAEIAEAAGFGKIAYFEKRKPIFVNL